jgi:hypothetical protein
MYAMIRSYPDAACPPAEVVHAGRRLASVLERAPGFISCVILRSNIGQLAVLTLFEDQANLEAAELRAAGCVANELRTVTASTELLRGEVVFQRGL